MKADVKNGNIEVVDPETGEILLSKPVTTNEQVFKLVYWMQRNGKAIQAMKPIVDRIVEKRIEDNAGQPLEFEERRLIFKGYQTFRIPPEAVISAFDDKDFAITVLTEAMRKDAVSQSGIKRLVDEKTITPEDAKGILAAKEPAGARAYAQIEKVKFDTKEGS